MLKQFLDFIKFYGKTKKVKIALFLLISVFAGCLEFFGIGLIYPFLMMIINPINVIKSPYYQYFVSLTNIQDFQINTLIIGGLIVTMFICKNLLMILCTYLQNKFVINWKNDINKMIMKFYLYAPYKKLFDNTNSEKIYNLTVLSSQTLETFVLRFLVFSTNAIIILLIFVLMLIKFPIIAIFTIVFVALCMMILSKFFKHKTEILAPKMLEYSLKNNNQIIENIKNLKEIRIFSAENFFLNKFFKTQKENNNIIFKNTFYASIPPFIVEIVLVLALILLAGLITWQNINETSKIIASYGLILAVIFRVAPALNRIQVAQNHLNSSKDIITKMNEEYIKNRFDEIVEKPKNIENIKFEDKIKFQNVYFEYKKDMPVITDATFEINQGEFIGIIGLSGAGKTTLADILMGLLPTNSGKILVDDVEIDENNIYGFRNLIGYVPQEINLLDGTFKQNITWGMEYYSVEDKKVKNSLELAQLEKIVEEKGGIDAVARGLSQGQKQRLMIARALYKEPEIIIFDEATSSLDVETENEITQMLKNLKGKKTIIAIAHRLTTLKECDKVIYLKDGVVKGFDTFDNLKNRYEDFEKLINLSKF